MGAFIAYFRRLEPPTELDYLEQICDKLDSIEYEIESVRCEVGNSNPDLYLEKILQILERWDFRTRASPSAPCPGQKESEQSPFSERVLSEIDHSASGGVKP